MQYLQSTALTVPLASATIMAMATITSKGLIIMFTQFEEFKMLLFLPLNQRYRYFCSLYTLTQEFSELGIVSQIDQ